MDRMSKNRWYNIYAMWLNSNTHSEEGCEWVVDGELGFKTYPGSWTPELVREYYRNGWNA